MSELGNFTARLSQVIANELETRRSELASETMRIFDLGCFPWHGYLELSFLTSDEPQIQGLPTFNTADWRLYNFAPQWPAAASLASKMKKE